MNNSTTREEKQRKKILEATLKEVALKGLNNVTMQSIAKTAGLSKGGLTHYFSSKQELFLAAFPYLFDKVVSECKSYSDNYSGAVDKLLSFDMIFKSNNPQVKLAHPILHNFMSVAAHDQIYRDMYHDWVETWVMLISNILEEGVAAKSFTCDDIEFTARTLSSIIQGIANRSFLAPQTHPTEWAVLAYREATCRLLGISPS